MTMWLALLVAAIGSTEVAVMPLSATEGIEKKTADALTEAVVAELRSLPGVSVVSQADIQAMLALEKQRDLLGCSEIACAADIGGALGVDFLVLGSVSLLGESRMLHLKLVDIKRASVAAQSDRRLRGASVDDLLDALPTVVSEMAIKALPPFGWLGLDTVPPKLGLRIDDEPTVKAPVASHRVSAGVHIVTTDAPCFKPLRLELTVNQGQERQETVQPEPRLAKLEVQPKTPDGALVQAEARLDGELLGPAPGTFEASACGKRLEVLAADGSSYSATVALTEGRSTTVVALLLPSAAAVAAVEDSQRFWRRLAWIGVGALLVGGGVVLDVAPASADNQRLDVLDVAPVVLYVGGPVLGLLGALGVFE